MAYGSLKNLVTALQAGPTLQGFSVVFGEENIPSRGYTLPMVVLSPQQGPFTKGQGYVKGAPTGVNRVWMVREQIEVMVWSIAPGSTATPIDHADATEDAAAAVLQAFDYQRPQGLMYYPISRRWETFDSAQKRVGRCLVLTIDVDVSVINVPPGTVIPTGIVIEESLTVPDGE